MKIDILTLFPNMFNGFLTESIIKRAIENNKVTINIHNIRDYSVYNNKQVDDTPYGGGAGMVLMCDPIFKAVDDLKTDDSLVIMMSPQGSVFKQNIAYDLSKKKHLIIICGHYEGFDERIGDYVLTGGELPSMIVTDAITRLIDGVIDEESHLNDSFSDNLLDYPTYTKPRVYNGMEVPEVLLSGHHENIKKWRNEQRILKTKEKRPDLMEE